MARCAATRTAALYRSVLYRDPRASPWPLRVTGVSYGLRSCTSTARRHYGIPTRTVWYCVGARAVVAIFLFMFSICYTVKRGRERNISKGFHHLRHQRRIECLATLSAHEIRHKAYLRRPDGLLSSFLRRSSPRAGGISEGDIGSRECTAHSSSCAEAGASRRPASPNQKRSSFEKRLARAPGSALLAGSQTD